ncbi:hypothetical protein [Desulfuromonas sp. TF]|jgi:hypothetical protein|uniref:hypothetical protein n=1 Tax=Desulfuromonas sp. TF TaxID=1232410 RepID=UPI0004214F28|nr:hypothetical protein [Desulfuromonas sp. TF]
MSQKKKSLTKHQPPKKQQSVFQEAWSNMSDDFNRLMPEKLRQRKGKKKFVLWLFILELVVLGVVGKFVYEWITGG